MEKKYAYESQIFKSVSTKMHKSWEGFFNEDIKKQLSCIEKKLEDTSYTPSYDKVLRFTEVDLYNVKVIWVGLDPYSEKGVATGRAFEDAKTKNKWGTDTRDSLKKIIKLIHKSHHNYDKTWGYQDVLRDIEKDNKITLLKPKKLFDFWEEQGVLFLNIAFTTEEGKDGSPSQKHIDLWSTFFNKLIEYIICNNKEVKYFIWGKKVKKKFEKYSNSIDQRNIYRSTHPRRNEEDKGFRRDSHFLNNPCFKETRDFINWLS